MTWRKSQVRVLYRPPKQDNPHPKTGADLSLNRPPKSFGSAPSASFAKLNPVRAYKESSAKASFLPAANGNLDFVSSDLCLNSPPKQRIRAHLAPFLRVLGLVNYLNSRPLICKKAIRSPFARFSDAYLNIPP